MGVQASNPSGPVRVGGEAADEFLDFLGLGLVGDEGGVVGLHHDGVAEADEADGGAAGRGPGIEDDVAGGIDVEEVGLGTIALGVRFEVTGEGVPGAEVVPGEVAIGDDDILGVFEQGEVDGDAFYLGVFGGQGAGEAGGTGGGGFEPAVAGLVHGGLMRLEALGDGDKGPDEHAGVPAVLSGLEVFEGGVVIGLLLEPFGAVEDGFVGFGALGRRERGADTDIAVAGGGFGGLDADGDDDLAAAGEVEGVGEDALELLLLGDDVVGGENGHDACGGAGADEGGAEGDGGAGIAADGFGHDIFPWQEGQLTSDLGGLGGVGDDENVFGRDDGENAVDGLLEEGLVAEEADELLGGLFAADGPEAFAATAGHDDDVAVGGAGFPGGLGLHERRQRNPERGREATRKRGFMGWGPAAAGAMREAGWEGLRRIGALRTLRGR